MTTRGLLAIGGDWRASTHKEEGAASGAGGESVAVTTAIARTFDRAGFCG